ncbi:hypothetical protein Mterra_04113 [Calidithermus terrae]|uniref:Uncharacterized protein n=1 Tax=Calidithermus terrae TaxID=1408545 RepID=A0A399DVV4_9DEIN|nr:hypothetical protein [Calidithermus terrae]RIH74142.1 hypothetical protein Mterra_04113 [Calidithermus terrae]
MSRLIALVIWLALAGLGLAQVPMRGIMDCRSGLYALTGPALRAEYRGGNLVLEYDRAFFKLKRITGTPIIRLEYTDSELNFKTSVLTPSRYDAASKRLYVPVDLYRLSKEGFYTLEVRIIATDRDARCNSTLIYRVSNVILRGD